MAVKKSIKEESALALEQLKKGQFVRVEVIRAKLGRYKKGDVLTMHVTTAKACAKNKAVALFDHAENVEMVKTENA